MALVRAGVLGANITIVEQAVALCEVGAGIQLGPNAMRIFQDWGLEKPLLDVGCEPESLVVRDARNDRVLTARPFRHQDDARQKYGAPHLCIRRADLQNVLLQAVVEAGVSLQLGCKFEKTDYSKYDVVLGCDGLHSKVREQLLAGTRHGGKPRPTGHTAYRAMVDRALLPMELRKRLVQVWLGERQHVVLYPVDERTMNVVIAQKEAPTLDALQSPLLGSLLGAVIQNGGLTQWALFDRPPMLSPKHYAMEHWALLGDAAHPMRPYLAQGAAMAIEDAQVLGMAIARKSTIHAALQHYAKARWWRNSRVQMRSQLQGFAFHASGFVRLARDAVLRVAGERLTRMRWLYDYKATPSP